jgi:preprotein translocase subunit Sss1
LHYITNKENTNFWKDIKNTAIPEKLKENIEHWKYNLPILEDFIETGSYALFKDPHFIQVLAGLEIFNRENLLKEYNQLSSVTKKLADKAESERQVLKLNKKPISHKEFIRRLRIEE